MRFNISSIIRYLKQKQIDFEIFNAADSTIIAFSNTNSLNKTFSRFVEGIEEAIGRTDSSERLITSDCPRDYGIRTQRFEYATDPRVHVMAFGTEFITDYEMLSYYPICIVGICVKGTEKLLSGTITIGAVDVP